MRELIDRYQVIEHEGEPLYVLVPYEEFLELVREREAFVPHEVVKIAVERDCSLVKAWRLHLGLSVEEVAEKAGLSVEDVRSLEESLNKPSEKLERIAKALGVSVEQLVDEE